MIISGWVAYKMGIHGSLLGRVEGFNPVKHLDRSEHCAFDYGFGWQNLSVNLGKSPR